MSVRSGQDGGVCRVVLVGMLRALRGGRMTRGIC